MSTVGGSPKRIYTTWELARADIFYYIDVFYNRAQSISFLSVILFPGLYSIHRAEAIRANCHSYMMSPVLTGFYWGLKYSREIVRRVIYAC